MPELHAAEAKIATPLLHEKSLRFRPLGWIAAWMLLLGAAVLLYWPALHAGYFSDDFLFYFTDPPARLYQYFLRVGDAAHAYRPVEAIILTFIQQHWHFETMPIHLLALACHAGLVCVVLAAARCLRIGIVGTAVACAVMFFTQVSTPAVLGNDTLSQSASALFGCLAAFLLWRRGKPSLWSVAALGVSLFVKETAFGFLLVIGCLTLLLAARETSWAKRSKSLVLLLSPYGGMVLLYFIMRHFAGGMLATHGRYGMHIGTNVLKNLASFGLAAFSPLSTVTSALALATHHRSVLVASLAAAACMILLTATGAFLSHRRHVVLILLALGTASLFPTFLLEHVSELYVYNAMPFVALTVGIAFAAVWRWKKAGPALATGAMLLFLAGQVFAVRQKAELMTLNGQRAANMIAAIHQYVNSLPSDSQVDLVRAATTAPTYSVFVLNGFDVLDYGNIELGKVLGRPDVRIEIVEEPEAVGLRPNDHLLLLGLNQNAGIERYAAGKP